MKKYFWIQIAENCDVGLCGKNLDIRFFIPDGLTHEQLEKLQDEITDAIEKYGEENEDDFSGIDYRAIIESATQKLNIKYEYPKVDYTIYA